MQSLCIEPARIGELEAGQSLSVQYAVALRFRRYHIAGVVPAEASSTIPSRSIARCAMFNFGECWCMDLSIRHGRSLCCGVLASSRVPATRPSISSHLLKARKLPVPILAKPDSPSVDEPWLPIPRVIALAFRSG
jgi:hypothetical protein